MLRHSVFAGLGLGLAAAVCMPVASANAGYADHMNLSCSVQAGAARPGDPPWVTALAISYLINLSASAVNGETLQIERRDLDGPKLEWDSPASASVPAAHYVLDLGTGSLFVSFDKFEQDGRKFSGAARRLRCTDRLLKIAV
jgi:hypothetical protein